MSRSLLVSQRINGAGWLQTDQQLDAAKVMIEVWANYVGSDAATAALFTFDPNNPGTPTSPGAGYLQAWFNCKVTNASTQTYSEVSSSTAAEPVPVGYAEYLYNALKTPHYQGTLIIVEQECSDVLPPGCVFNTSDGRPEWQAMSALVMSVEEDIFTGTTTVQFGPPMMLGLDEKEELFRANLGRIPSYKLDQRTTGKTTAGSNIKDAKHAADTNTVKPPVAAPAAQAFPFQVIWRNNPADPTGNTFQAKVQLNSKPSIKQYVQTDMVVQNISLNGEAAVYPYPL